MSVTTVRFGFVDTKMARADRKPWMMTPDRAAAIVLRAVRTRPVQVTRPAVRPPPSHCCAC